MRTIRIACLVAGALLFAGSYALLATDRGSSVADGGVSGVDDAGAVERQAIEDAAAWADRLESETDRTRPEFELVKRESERLRRESERARIRTHLLGAEWELRTADVSHLSDAQRERRARAIELLGEYRRAGEFPHNHDFPDERVPYFVDRHGTLCAMAYLIAHTGGEELVERVARFANNAYVDELAADPAFRDWLDRHGMTVAEAARVQPAYDDCCQGGYPVAITPPDDGYELATAASATLSGTAIVVQLLDDGAPDAWRSLLGITAGGAAGVAVTLRF